MEQTIVEDRIVRPAEAKIMTGRSLATMWRDEKAGVFPKRRKLGRKGAVGYLLSELQEWINTREIVGPDNVNNVCPGSRRGRRKKEA